MMPRTRCPKYSVEAPSGGVVDVHIALPGVETAAEIILEIRQRQHLFLEAAGEGVQYVLKVDLPFQVNDDAYRVKFNKRTSNLKFSAPALSASNAQAAIDAPVFMNSTGHKPECLHTPSISSSSTCEPASSRDELVDERAMYRELMGDDPYLFGQACNLQPPSATHNSEETDGDDSHTAATKSCPGSAPGNSTVKVASTFESSGPDQQTTLDTLPIQLSLESTAPTSSATQTAPTTPACGGSIAQSTTSTSGASFQHLTSNSAAPATTTSKEPNAPASTNTASITPPTSTLPTIITATTTTAHHPTSSVTAASATTKAAKAGSGLAKGYFAKGKAAAAVKPADPVADSAGPTVWPSTQLPLRELPPEVQPTTRIQAELAASIDCSGLAALMLADAGGVSPWSASSRAANPKKAKKPLRKRLHALLEQVVSSLNTRGYAVCDHFHSPDAILAIRDEIRQMEAFYEVGEIWLGKTADVGAQIAVRDVRGDSILWMDEQALTAHAFVKDGKRYSCSFHTLHQSFRALDRLVMVHLSKEVPDLAHVRERTDVMLAVYPGDGARFAKHVDNTARDGRCLTVLTYYNPDWTPQQGGALRLFIPGKDTPVDVLPEGGRVAMFWSRSVAHEVMPSWGHRHAATVWYYDGVERAEALALAKVPEGGYADPASQVAARELIKAIMAGDSFEPTQEDCRAVQRMAQAASAPALKIVAAVTGASTAQECKAALLSLDPDSLRRLRTELGGMGLVSHTPSFAGSS